MNSRETRFDSVIPSIVDIAGPKIAALSSEGRHQGLAIVHELVWMRHIGVYVITKNCAVAHAGTGQRTHIEGEKQFEVCPEVLCGTVCICHSSWLPGIAADIQSKPIETLRTC